MSDVLPDVSKDRRSIGLEILVVLTLFYVPTLASGTEGWILQGRLAVLPEHIQDPSTFSNARLVQSLISFGSMVPVLLLIMARGKGGLQGVGLGPAVRFGYLAIIPIALAFYLTSWLAIRIYAPFLDPVKLAEFFQGKHHTPGDLGATHLSLLGVNVAVAVFLEEFVMRGFLMSRFTQLNWRPWTSILVSSALFASYHIYQGPVSVSVIFVDGIVFALAFRITKSVWPVFVAHWLIDMIIFFIRLGGVGA